MTVPFPGFKRVVGVPTEEQQVQSDLQEIIADFDRLACILIDVPAEMMLNLDETGHCDWVNAEIFLVLVRAGFSDVKIPAAVKRQLKRFTLLRTIVIVHCDTVETELCDSEFTPNRACYRIQENVFITSGLLMRARLECDSPDLVLIDG
jgi:hypothetical protein